MRTLHAPHCPSSTRWVFNGAPSRLVAVRVTSTHEGGAQPLAPAVAQASLIASRRSLLLGSGSITVVQALVQALPAQAASGIGRYIKKKKLDPLETYVPLVLEAEEELLALKGTLAANTAGARESLRSGAFSALRDNVRALGEYAQTNGVVKDATPLVNGFFRKLESFDLLLYRSVKDGTPVDEEEAERQLQEAVSALSELTATVPGDVLERSRQILDKVKGRIGSSSSGEPESASEKELEDVELLNELLSIWE